MFKKTVWEYSSISQHLLATAKRRYVHIHLAALQIMLYDSTACKTFSITLKDMNIGTAMCQLYIIHVVSFTTSGKF